MLTVINQETYGPLKIDKQEKDCVIITQSNIHPKSGRVITEVIFIEKKHLKALMVDLNAS